MRQLRDVRVALFATVVVALALAVGGINVVAQSLRSVQAGASPSLAVSYTGLDYYEPSTYFSGCPRWTTLTTCYTHNSSGGITAQQILTSDTAWIASHHMGQFQRFWVMLNQGIQWDASGNYAGLSAVYLSNLDDALARFHAAGIRLDLVLYEASKGSTEPNQFRVEALDGIHPQLRAGQLQALRDVVNHLAANPTDVATVAVMDLFNEAWYQLSNIGFSESVIHQWLQDEYDAAHGAQPGFPYTVSDTTRLLKDYAKWNSLTPGDVIDEHLYDDDPGSSALYPGQSVSHAAFWARTAAFERPWIAGEAGCSPGNTGCTYSGTNALAVDTYWLDHMRAYGAQAVLIEDRSTAISSPNGPTSQTPTLVGQKIQQVTQAQPAPLPPSTAVPPSATLPVPVTSTAAPASPVSSTSTAVPSTATSVPAPTATALPSTPTRVPTAAPTPMPTPTPLCHHRHHKKGPNNVVAISSVLALDRRALPTSS